MSHNFPMIIFRLNGTLRLRADILLGVPHEEANDFSLSHYCWYWVDSFNWGTAHQIPCLKVFSSSEIVCHLWDHILRLNPVPQHFTSDFSIHCWYLPELILHLKIPNGDLSNSIMLLFSLAEIPLQKRVLFTTFLFLGLKDFCFLFSVIIYHCLHSFIHSWMMRKLSSFEQRPSETGSCVLLT